MSISNIFYIAPILFTVKYRVVEMAQQYSIAILSSTYFGVTGKCFHVIGRLTQSCSLFVTSSRFFSSKAHNCCFLYTGQICFNSFFIS